MIGYLFSQHIIRDIIVKSDDNLTKIWRKIRDLFVKNNDEYISELSSIWDRGVREVYALFHREPLAHDRAGKILAPGN